MFDERAYEAEHSQRLRRAFIEAHRDNVTPKDIIRREIEAAIRRKNPFLNHSDPFIAMGHDGYDFTWFPTGSFQSEEAGLVHIKTKRTEEPLYSEGEEISSTFNLFKKDGTLVG